MSVKLLLPCLLALACAACASSSDDPSGAAGPSLDGSASAGDLTAELRSDGPLTTGLATVRLALAAGGAPVTDATVTFMPWMTMSGGMKHSAPVLGPATLGEDGAFAAEVVFQMPTSDMGSWSATSTVTRPGQAPVELAFAPFTVTDAGRAKVLSYDDAASGTTRRFVVSLNLKGQPAVGLNPAVLTLHEMKEMGGFAEVAGATLSIDPQMPAMGHGSPGSVQPAATSLGRFDAQVSFSMPGAWDTTVTVREASVTLGSVAFSTTF